MTVHQLKPSELTPYFNNPRKNDDAVIKVAESISAFGFRNPIIVDAERVIIAGHTRWKAALKLNLKTVPVIIADDMPPDKVKAYRIADNRVGEFAEWDWEQLKIEMDDFSDDIVALLDFEIPEITEIHPGLIDDDEIPEVKEAICKPGDLWQLGEHRLLCGDSTNADDVTRLMGGEKADMVFTSPPYLQQRDYGVANEKISDWDGLMFDVFSILPVVENCQIFVNLGIIHRDNKFVLYFLDWINKMDQIGWRPFGIYIWDQCAGLMGNWNGRLSPSFEFIFHFNKESIQPKKWIKTKDSSQKKKKKGDRGQRGKDGIVKEIYSPDLYGQPFKIPDNVIRISRNATIDMARNNHPATFPIQLPEFIINSWDGNLYEPFLGSGSTLIACEKTGRKCYGMEIDPHYCDVIIQRWQDYTGQTAKLIKGE